MGFWVGEEEEFDGAAGYEAGDVAGLVAVYVLEVPVRGLVSREGRRR